LALSLAFDAISKQAEARERRTVVGVETRSAPYDAKNWIRLTLLASIMAACGATAPLVASSETIIAVPLNVDVEGVMAPQGIADALAVRLVKLIDAGYDPDGVPADRIGICMRPEIEAAVEIAYYVTLRAELYASEAKQELCREQRKRAPTSYARLSWAWLRDCMVASGDIDDDEATEKLMKLRAEEKIVELE
jgi:hypothetical protein